MEATPTIKVIIIGDSSVGKSQLAARYVLGTFSEETEATIGCEFFSKRIIHGDSEYNIQCWDTAGQDKFCGCSAPYYRTSKGCLLVFSITSMLSFKDLTKWLIELDRYTSEPDFAVVCVGNKADLNYNREVSYQTAQNFCYQYGFEYIETSAKTGDNVQEAFDLLVGNIVEAMANPNYRKEHAAGFTLTADSHHKENKNTKTPATKKNTTPAAQRGRPAREEYSETEESGASNSEDGDNCCN